jgi:hypothetical protein
MIGMRSFRRDALPGELLGEHPLLEQVLRGSNRRSLLEQLMAVVASFDDEVPRRCGIPEDTEDFARSVRDNRNYYTHPTSDRPTRVAAGGQLLVLEHRLWFLVRACLFRELGFS